MRPAFPVARLAFVLTAGAALAACSTDPPPDEPYRKVLHGDAERGLALVSRYQCGGCHAVPQAPSESMRIAPPLEAFGRRSYIAGRVPNSPAALQRWLQDPQSLVPGTRMPDLGMSEADARDIAAYLLSLR
jgi:cytochrome c1